MLFIAWYTFIRCHGDNGHHSSSLLSLLFRLHCDDISEQLQPIPTPAILIGILKRFSPLLPYIGKWCNKGEIIKSNEPTLKIALAWFRLNKIYELYKILLSRYSIRLMYEVLAIARVHKYLIKLKFFVSIVTVYDIVFTYHPL